MSETVTASGLPAPLTRFIGRGAEVATLAAQLAEARLVTITGPGGSGKTRLALATCDRLQASGGLELHWTPLAELGDPALFAPAVAAAVGAAEAPGWSPAAALVRHLHDRPTLLVLDNCEHLVEASAGLIGALLRACPRLRVLATSREPLGLAGERTWPVNGLTLPADGPAGTPGTSAAVSASEAAQLFADRARLVSPTFELTDDNADTIARICRRLDGLPLALELAAARLRVLPLPQLLDRLDDAFAVLVTAARDVPARHQTLRATLDWSHDLLPRPERGAFAGLSVFRGGFTLEAAEGVLAEQAAPGAVLDLLGRLVEKSLVQVHSAGGDERYRLLEVVRQYADQRLDARRADVAARHARYYLAVAEHAEERLAGPEQLLWLDRLHREQDNIRAALGWTRRHDPQLGVRLAGAMGRYCRLRGSYAEGREWLRAAAAAIDGHTPPAAAAKVLIALGTLEFLGCEYDRATDRLSQALDLYAPGEEPRVAAAALQVLGGIAREQGRYADARARHGDALAIWRQLDDPTGIARSIKALGFTAWLEGAYDRADELADEALRRFRDLGDGEGVIGALVDLGATTLRQGDHARAERLLRESQAKSSQLGSREGTAWSTELLGLLAAARSDRSGALRLLRESLVVHHELGDRWRTASVLEALAGELARGPDVRAAASLLAAAKAVRAEIGAPVPPGDRAEARRRRAAVVRGLDPAELAAAEAEGRAMPLDQAVATAMAAPPIDAAAPTDPTPAAVATPIDASAPTDPTPAAVVGPPDPAGESAALRVYALGRARVELAGRQLGTEDWTYAKPRELLYFLLTRPGANKAQIGLALWPDASAQELRNSFHTGVKHLRRALGGPGRVRFSDGGYTVDRSQPFDYDVDAFDTAAERALTAARAAGSDGHAAKGVPVAAMRNGAGPGGAGGAEGAGGSPEDPVAALAAAAAHYGGDFLADLAVGGWANARREALRHQFEQVQLTLGALLGRQGRYAEAAAAFSRLVADDPLLEVAHRGLMRCHAALGNTARAVRQYQELADLVGAELGTTPAPETTALYTRLRRGEPVLAAQPVA